ncbi:hypothetical protein EMCRGX_G000784 [Ephydatia muelleri]
MEHISQLPDDACKQQFDKGKLPDFLKDNCHFWTDLKRSRFGLAFKALTRAKLMSTRTWKTLPRSYSAAWWKYCYIFSSSRELVRRTKKTKHRSILISHFEFLTNGKLSNRST